MEVDNLHVRRGRKKDRSKLRCYNCQKIGHIASDRQNNVEVQEELSPEDVEYITFGCVDEFDADASAIAPEEEARQVAHATARSRDMKNQALMIKSGVMNGKVVKVLIDSGATNSLCRLGLGKNVMRLKNVRIAGYDGVLSQETQTIEVKETIHVDFFTFKDTVMTEWDLKDKAFDVILDQPWFRKFNPVINWRKHEIESIDDEVEVNTVSTSVPGWIIKLCHFDPQPLPKPPEIVELLEEFKDVFPAELPDQLPPKRAVQFDLQLKPDAKPQNRAPFRLAK
ncbi:unnamed protein product, partial [Aphanomyces euteiches]